MLHNLLIAQFYANIKFYQTISMGQNLIPSNIHFEHGLTQTSIDLYPLPQTPFFSMLADTFQVNFHSSSSPTFRTFPMQIEFPFYSLKSTIKICKECFSKNALENGKNKYLANHQSVTSYMWSANVILPTSNFTSSHAAVTRNCIICVC